MDNQHAQNNYPKMDRQATHPDRNSTAGVPKSPAGAPLLFLLLLSFLRLSAVAALATEFMMIYDEWICSR